MNPVIRMIGKVLRLVGISSPEDSAPKSAQSQLERDGLPSWRKAAQSAKPDDPAQQPGPPRS